ncbi:MULTISPECIES: hypothetical protein [unclassified Lysinibacillus]|uniref:hypothetical protein n=1 Tax=unclassified Lysinibacillus TaxID=2636778 RepID=UPI0035E2FCA3
MGWFSKKKHAQDNLEKADQVLNKGLSGMMMKGLIPKQHREAMNQSIEQTRQAQMATGGSVPITATAIVLSVRDTGKLINFEPVVILELEVTETRGSRYTKTLETLVSKLQVPRAGDHIGLGQHPANPAELIYVGPMT